MINFRPLLLLFILFILGCGDDKSDRTPEYIKVCRNELGQVNRGDNFFCNVTILLDLSNRIEKDKQTDKDLSIIKTILDVFQNAQEASRYQLSKDRLSIAISKQKGDKVTLNIDQNDLIIDMDRENSKGINFPEFCKQKEVFVKSIKEAYNYSKENKSFYGADIWNFFNEDISSSIKLNNGKTLYKNKIIILTDGYLNFERTVERKRPKGTYMRGFYKMRNNSKWKDVFEKRNYKLTSHSRDYPNLEVLVLEVEPKRPTEYTNEFEILSHYWSTWFKDMNIPCEVYPKSKSIKDLIPVLKDFLFN